MININIEKNVLKSNKEDVVCILCGGTHQCLQSRRTGGMYISKKTRSFVYDLISSCGKYDPESCRYELDIDDLTDIHLEQFAYHIYLDNPDIATDATSVENNLYDRLMLPALLNHLKDSTDKDESIEFVRAWREGMVLYLEEKMAKTLRSLLIDFNHPLYGNAA